MATDTNIATMVSIDVDDETNSGNSTDTNIATMVSVDVDHIHDASQTCCSAPNNESVGIVDITDIEMIQDILDSEIRNLSVGWIASIPFHAFIVNYGDETDHLPTNFQPDVVNICSFLGGNKYPASRLVLCPNTYKPPSSNENMSTKELSDQCNGWVDLRKALESAAWFAGNPIISNGSQVSNQRDSNNRVFRCGTYHRSPRSSTNAFDDLIAYRCSSLIHDKANNRENGKKLPKRIKTVDNSCQSCKFQFTVKWIVNAYFYIELRQKSGCSLHISHTKNLDPGIISIPTRLLTTDQFMDVVHVSNATSNNGSGRNYLHSKFGLILSSMKAAYLSRRENGVIQSAEDDITLMMDNMYKSKEISFVSLADVPANDYCDGPVLNDSSGTVTISTRKHFSGDVECRQIPPEGSEVSCLTPQIIQERHGRHLDREDILFIGVAWIVKPAFRLFKLCPEVVWVDVTSHSNNKGFHLLTFSSRLSIGKQVVWLWIFIPNQQRFSFRWVFQEAIPILVPKWLRDRVLFFMKDADPQQRNEILASMTNTFVNASEGTCGYHVVHQGWRKNVPSCTNIFPPTQLKKWSYIVHQIHKWIYSWMNPGNVEDEDEYEISKFLLEKFVCSQAVQEIVGDNKFLIPKIISFLRKHVYTWETLYLHYRRSHIRHFDTAHSSPHEGTNHGLKSHAAAVKPTMNLDASATTINTQVTLRVHECEDIIYQEAKKIKIQWSMLPTSNHTVTIAEGILQHMMKRIKLYQFLLVSRESSKCVFQVTYASSNLAHNSTLRNHSLTLHNGNIAVGNDDHVRVGIRENTNPIPNVCTDNVNRNNNNDLSPIPVFSRVRTVSVDGSGIMLCSCKHFERTGLPCVHQASVASLCHDEMSTPVTGSKDPFLGFTHHDISVRWWSQYMYYAYRPTTPSSINKYFHVLASHPIRGPKLRCKIPMSMIVHPGHEIMPAIYRLTNYPKNSISISQLKESVLSQRWVHISQTQEEEEENNLFNYMNEHLCDEYGGDLNDTFSQSVSNCDFFSRQKERMIMSRVSLKQLWEECCTEADNRCCLEGQNLLEKHLQSFLAHCNGKNAIMSTNTHTDTCPLSENKKRRNIPMTHGKYQGRAKRVFNTHHM